jgi:molecular chaperone GrpE
MSDTGETVNKHSDAQHAAPDAPASGDGEAPNGVTEDGLPGLVAEVISDQIEDADESALRGDVDELVAAAAQRDEYLALAQRTQADFENYRKRVARESAAAFERGTSALAKELLPALDNLDRALEEAAGSDADAEDPLLAGVRLVRAELSAALARARIESYSPVGEPFDPALHEAMATAEQPPDGHPSGTVVEVYQPGYRIGTSIIRPARVVVAA